MAGELQVLEPYDVRLGEIFQSVAGVEDQRSRVGDQAVVECRVIGEDGDTIHRLHDFRG